MCKGSCHANNVTEGLYSRSVTTHLLDILELLFLILFGLFRIEQTQAKAQRANTQRSARGVSENSSNG